MRILFDSGIVNIVWMQLLVPGWNDPRRAGLRGGCIGEHRAELKSNERGNKVEEEEDVRETIPF